MKKLIYPNWYKINDIWHLCIALSDGTRYIDGVKQPTHEM